MRLMTCPFPDCDIIAEGEHAEIAMSVHLVQDHPVWPVSANEHDTR